MTASHAHPVLLSSQSTFPNPVVPTPVSDYTVSSQCPTAGRGVGPQPAPGLVPKLVTSAGDQSETRGFLKLLFIYYFWLHWVFVAACGLSLVAASGGYSSLRCVGFSLPWLLLLRSTGSRRMGFSSCGAWALEHRLSSCGARAQ